jgi:hypothetical protein
VPLYAVNLTTLVCSPSQGRKQPPARVGGLSAIKSVIKNKAGEREGVRLPISGKSEGGAALEHQVPPRARCRSRESCPQVLSGPLQPAYHAIVPLPMK